MKRQKRAVKWKRLDNAAKIFPSNSSKRDTKVFRFACELYEPVQQAALQTALDETLELFPLYRSILKRGLFWYYLEETELSPLVRIEDRPPCSTIYDRNSKSLLFDVTYYQNRINLEVYHALTDGTGALAFLRTLVCHYLIQVHSNELKGFAPLIDYDATLTQKEDDSFQKYYSGKKLPFQLKRKRAFKLRGMKLPEYRIHIIEGVMPAKQVIEKAKEYHTTVTVLFTSLFLLAIHSQQSIREQKRPVSINVPVNLRKFFPSESARNFFGLITVVYDFSAQSDKLEDVVSYVSHYFKEELTKEKMELRMNAYTAIERNILARVVPLPLKDLVLHIVGNFNNREVTGALSNVGIVTLPAEISEYVRLFDVFTATNRLQICMCSYQNHMTVSFTSPFISCDIEKHFFRSLTAMGISVELSANRVLENKEKLNEIL